MAYVAAVTLLAGVALFAIPPFGQMPLLHQIALTGGALALWAFSDGLFGRLSVLMALLEATLLLRLSLGWTRLLVDALGVPADAAVAAWPGT
jgi:hypothetical protein